MTEKSSIPIRHPHFELSDALELAWLGGDALRSQYFNGMLMIFPSGERYLVESLRRVVTDVSNSLACEM